MRTSRRQFLSISDSYRIWKESLFGVFVMVRRQVLLMHHLTVRLAGVMLVNPWISTDSGVARTYLKHYYRERFKDTGFWRKIFKGQVDWCASLHSLTQTALRLCDRNVEDTYSAEALSNIIFDALGAYEGITRILISERDMTAREFEDEYQKRMGDGRLSEKRSGHLIRAVADHTFSTHRRMSIWRG